MTLREKLNRLKKIILKYNSCLIAFSGGVDSTFLLRVAKDILPKDKLLAVTASSATYPKEELLFSKSIAACLSVRHKIIKTGELKDIRFISNPINRCYFCKTELFLRLKDIAKKEKLNFVLDASNISDKSDFRPGDVARDRLNIRSPLLEAGLTKEDIRKLSKDLKLPTWDKPGLACLASRIPYGMKISPDILKRINQAEVYLRKEGFKQVRVRHYGSLCRVEVEKDEVCRLVKKQKKVSNRLKGLGYNHVTVDLEGYRTGSLNPVFANKEK
jgi:uncharacterized protein